MQKPRKVKFGLGPRRAFGRLTDVEATAVVIRLDEIAERIPEAAVPFTRVTEVGGVRVAYEVTAD
ncbi:MAG: hypothetical protein WBV82_20270, partial [Myxococcaceae bacterium]